MITLGFLMTASANTDVLNDETTSHARLDELIRTKQAVIGVIGLGYVGLPLVRAFSRPASGPWASTSTNEGRQAQGGRELHQAHRLRRRSRS